MQLQIFQVDAFTNKVFGGNPAAVIPLQSWLPEPTMQAIANENNLSETAFFVAASAVDEADFQLRWFTPQAEVSLCGHATLAAAAVIFEKLKFQGQQLRFNTLGGKLVVERCAAGYSLLLPRLTARQTPLPAALKQAIGCEIVNSLLAEDWLLELANETELCHCRPDMNALLADSAARGVIITASGDSCDFVSRFFAPKLGINEDPVTGSAHSPLTDYWGDKLNKREMIARQLSPRGGEIHCQLQQQSVLLEGQCAFFMSGEICF